MTVSRSAIIVALGAASFASGSLAADMPAHLEMPPPAILDPAPVSMWTGFYVGGTTGVQLSAHTWTTSSLQTPGTMTAGLYNVGSSRADFGSTNFRPAGHVGYNFQIDPRFVAGLEADMGGPAYDTHKVQGIPGTYGGATALTQSTDTDLTRGMVRWDASIRGRLGFLATPTVLVYGTGGVAFGSARYGISCAGGYPVGSWCGGAIKETYSKSLTGLTFGAGVDAMFNGAWIARAEYRFTNYGARNLNFFATPAADTVSARLALKTHTFMVGLSYKFSDTPSTLIGSRTVEVSKY